MTVITNIGSQPAYWLTGQRWKMSEG